MFNIESSISMSTKTMVRPALEEKYSVVTGAFAGNSDKLTALTGVLGEPKEYQKIKYWDFSSKGTEDTDYAITFSKKGIAIEINDDDEDEVEYSDEDLMAIAEDAIKRLGIEG